MMRSRPLLAALLAAAIAPAGLTGCATIRNRTVYPNPMVVHATSFDAAWDATVHALDEDFEIDEENRLARRISTFPETAATIVEPWRRDSIGLRQRLEATLQTYRRFAIARVEPVEGGFEIDVEVWKELEFLDRPERATGAQAAFPQDYQINRSREVIGPVAPPLGWLPKGRDFALEQRILRRIERELLGEGAFP
ncbi:hypothetical protein [Tautonia sociabilis]|uniref:Uncharacterized protein n=1 Tax=Tautonia sociabilis TaxID=2080755 RepID=A0A432MMK9_9BACT|nr:hypothetical protein [Tautonia sociabilis]RUL88479.1 hypothetical protein TsocGM_07125 [Tautonia sociabilis]